ncbi:MAG: MFS transporter [Fibrobacterota bacterium]
MFKISRRSAWILYDWANSAYALTVLTAFFPILFKKYWAVGLADSTVLSLQGAANSWAGIFAAAVVPFAAAFVSASNRRKSYLIFWTVTGAGAVMLLSMVGAGRWGLALGIFVISKIAFQFCLFFYDTLLPDVSTPDNRHVVSSQGYAWGYLGGALLFTVNVLMVTYQDSLPFPGVMSAERIAVFSAGAWWLFFSLPLFRATFAGQNRRGGRGRIPKALHLLKNEIFLLGARKDIILFLCAYWFYIDGVYTVISMSSAFALSLGIGINGIILSLLFVQVVAFPSSLIAGRIAQRRGARQVILLMVAGYFILIFTGALFLNSAAGFFVLAGITGMLQGGVQSLSRSYFIGIIPVNQRTLLLGLFNTVSRFSVILGPAVISAVTYAGVRWLRREFLFTLIDEYLFETLTLRGGFLSVTLFFAAGAVCLSALKPQSPQG